MEAKFYRAALSIDWLFALRKPQLDRRQRSIKCYVKNWEGSTLSAILSSDIPNQLNQLFVFIPIRRSQRSDILGAVTAAGVQ